MNFKWLILFIELLIPFQTFGCSGPRRSLFYPKSTMFGNRQTPINLIEGPNEMSRKIPNLVFENYQEVPSRAWLHNRGSTIQLLTEWPSGKAPVISGGALRGKYTFDSLHFHWGSQNCCGSEHQLNGKIFPMEIHVIHKFTGLSSDKIATTVNSLTVLGFFVSIAQNSQLRSFTNYIGAVKQFNSTVDIPPFALSQLIPEFQEYFTYPGSLTIPPFPETVIWIVPKNELLITSTEIETFRTTLDKDNQPVTSSARSIQPLGKGQILYYVMSDRIKFLTS